MTLRVSPSVIVDEAERSGSPGLLARGSHWDRVALADVARVVNGAAFSSRLFNNEARGLPLVRIRDVGAKGSATWYEGPFEDVHRVRHGDILVGMDGDFRVATWGGTEALLNQRVCRIVVDESRYDSRFLVLVLQGYLDAIWKATSSVTVKHLSSRSIAEIPLPHPPLAEQQRIVEILDDHLSRLDAADLGAASAVQRLASLREGLVRTELTGGRGQAAVVSAGLEAAGVDDGALPAMPPGWKWKRLCDLADVIGGVTKDAARQSDPAFVEVPYLRVANVQRGRLDLSSVTSIRVPRATADKLRLLPGDVLLNEGGDRDKLGRGWVWEGQVESCIHQNHVFRARVRDGCLDPYLLSWAANTFGGRWCERNGRQSVNLASISLSKIKMMPVPVPPRTEQEAVAERIREVMDASMRLERDVAAARRRRVLLHRALLAAAFSGRLTMTRDADRAARVDDLVQPSDERS